MSDDDEMEDYGFEYSDEEPEEENVDIENQYYHAKEALENGEHEDALEGFAAVVDMQSEKGEWGFKALKQIVKLRHKLGQHDKMMEAYEEMLGYIKSSVTRNDAEKKLNSLLDYVSSAPASASQAPDASSSSSSSSLKLLQAFYDVTLKALLEAKNDRLWFKTNLKLCELHFQTQDFAKLAKTIKELHRSCRGEDGVTEDVKKGTQLLEIIAIEVQMHTSTKNNKKLKELYHKALAIKSAIPHPRILGVIRESGGKMHMSERQFEQAATDFFEAFKAYDEAAISRRIDVLKYLVLASMLSGSSVDPFDAQEAKPYKDDPEIKAMSQACSAYMARDIATFERVLRQHAELTKDAFVRQHVTELMRNLRSSVLLRLVAPYSRVFLDQVAAECLCGVEEVQDLLVELILDGKVFGTIDQIGQDGRGVLHLNTGGDADGRYRAMHKQANAVAAAHKAICALRT